MLLSWYIHGVELSLTHCQSLPVAGTNLKLGHCRQGDSAPKGGYGHRGRLLHIGAGDVAGSIRNAERGSVVVDTFSSSSSISLSYWERGRAG